MRNLRNRLRASEDAQNMRSGSTVLHIRAPRAPEPTNPELVGLRLAGLAPAFVFPTECGDGSGYYEGDLPLFEVTRGARLHIGIPRNGITEKTMCGKSVGTAAGLFHAPRPLCPKCRALFNAIDAGPDAPKARA